MFDGWNTVYNYVELRFWNGSYDNRQIITYLFGKIFYEWNVKTFMYDSDLVFVNVQ